MEKIVLDAELRNQKGKGPNRRLRAEGKIPAVLYGGEAEPQSLALNAHAFAMALKKTHTMVTLQMPAGEQTVMLGEMQREPVSHRVVHVDLMRIEAGHEVHAHVEVIGLGTPMGVREGAVLERPLREVEIRCLPADLPEKIEINIEHLQINDAVKAGDLPLGENVHLVTDSDTVMFHVLIAKAGEEAPTEAAEEGAAQPELVGKKKEAEAEAEK